MAFSLRDIVRRMGGALTPSVMAAIDRMREGIRVPLGHRRPDGTYSRVLGGLGDVRSLDAAALRSLGTTPVVSVPRGGGYSADEDALDTGFNPQEDFDANQLIPCVSSNVDGFYYVESDDALTLNTGTLFIQFQKRKGDKVGGAPIGPPRVYRYDECPLFVYEALFAASSKGGTVHDLIKNQIDGEKL